MSKAHKVFDLAAGRERRVTDLVQYVAERRDVIEDAIIVYSTRDGVVRYASTSSNRLIQSGLLVLGQSMVSED